MARPYLQCLLPGLWSPGLSPELIPRTALPPFHTESGFRHSVPVPKMDLHILRQFTTLSTLGTWCLRNGSAFATKPELGGSWLSARPERQALRVGSACARWGAQDLLHTAVDKGRWDTGPAGQWAVGLARPGQGLAKESSCLHRAEWLRKHRERRPAVPHPVLPILPVPKGMGCLCALLAGGECPGEPGLHSTPPHPTATSTHIPSPHGHLLSSQCAPWSLLEKPSTAPS